MTEHEITAPVPLVGRAGFLNPASIGWTRTQLHDTDRIGRGLVGWGRNKRWEYWAVTTPTHIIAMTIAAIDYANIRQLWVFDRATHETIDTFEIKPFSAGIRLPGTLGAGTSSADGRRLSLEFSEEASATRLRARSPRVQVDVRALIPAGHEAIGTAAPLGRILVDYTVKDVDRPAVGTVTIDGLTHDVAEGASWAVLDHARSRGKYATHWNWGAGAGLVDSRRIGLQLGGGGPLAIRHGISQNGFTVNGRVHKVAAPLTWRFDPDDFLAPWRIGNDRIDLLFTPVYDRFASTQLVLVAGVTHQCFGSFAGHVITDEGERIAFSGLNGWAEDVHNRW